MSDKLTEHYSEILSILGEDVNREGLVDTPKRAAKAMHASEEGKINDLQGLAKKYYHLLQK